MPLRLDDELWDLALSVAVTSSNDGDIKLANELRPPQTHYGLGEDPIINC